MEKLNFLGIGPRIGVFALPWLTFSCILNHIYKPMFSIIPGKSTLFLYFGIVLTTTGSVFYIATVRHLLKGLKETKLVTDGTFYLCRNPLYASLILFVIPGVSIIVNSWLILTSGLVGYIVFKLNIKKESMELEKFFGVRYNEYKETTPEFFPFPYKKWFK